MHACVARVACISHRQSDRDRQRDRQGEYTHTHGHGRAQGHGNTHERECGGKRLKFNPNPTKLADFTSFLTL